MMHEEAEYREPGAVIGVHMELERERRLNRSLREANRSLQSRAPVAFQLESGEPVPYHAVRGMVVVRTEYGRTGALRVTVAPYDDVARRDLEASRSVLTALGERARRQWR